MDTKKMKILQSPDSKILLIALIAVLIFWYVSPDSGAKREIQKLKQDIKASKVREEKLNTLYIGAMKRINFMEIKRKQDSLATVRAIKERDIANRKTRLAYQKYEEIKFVDLGSDSARLRTISELYPSINH